MHKRISAVLFLITLAAGPATKPVVKHAPATPPKDWVKSENVTAHYEFYTPKKWDGSGQKGEHATFTPPMPERKQPDNPSPTAPNLDSVKQPSLTIESTKGAGGTLEAEVDLYRKSLKTDEPGFKVKSDVAAQMGDRAGWLFITDENYKAGTQKIPGGKEDKTKDVIHKLTTYKLLAVDGDQLVTITLQADAGLYGTAMGSCKKVIDTFTWTDSEDKK